MKKFKCNKCKSINKLEDMADNNSGNCYECESKEVLLESEFYSNLIK